MDFRPNFYLPSQAKEGLAAKTSQNLQEIAAFERAITPDLAKTMTDITRTYPS